MITQRNPQNLSSSFSHEIRLIEWVEECIQVVKLKEFNSNPNNF